MRVPELPQAGLMTLRPRGARLKVLRMTIFHALAQICINAHAAQLPRKLDSNPLACVKGISQPAISADTHAC